MPLNKQTVAIPLGQGVNTKIDPKQLQPGQLTNLQNGVFNQQGLIQKRYGLDLLSRHINVTDENILRGEALSTYQDQLLLFTGAKAYSRLAFNEKWSDKGNVSSVINSSFQVIRNDYQQSNPDAAKVNGLECYVYEDSRGGVRYSIIDAETGNFIIADQLLTLLGSKVKVFPLLETDDVSSQFVIFWITENTTSINYARLYTDSLHTNPTIYTLVSDLHEDLVYDGCSSIGAVNDVTDSSIFLSYAARFNATYVYTNPRTYKITADAVSLWSYDVVLGSTSPVHISVSPLADASFSLSAQAGVTAAIMWDDGTDLKLGKIPYYIGPLTSIDLSVPLDFNVADLQTYTFGWNGEVFTDQVDLDVFFEFESDGYKNVRGGTLQASLHGEIVATATLANLAMRKGISLYSKPFNHNANTYVLASYESDLQPTYFLMNVSLDVISKANQNYGGGHRTNQLSEIILDSYTITDKLTADGYTVGLPIGSGVFKIPTLKKGKLQSESGSIFSRLGVVSTSLDFISENHFLTTVLNDNMYVVGGVLQSYDGNQFTENGFHLYPEQVNLIDNRLIITTTQQGSAVQPEITSVSCVPGSCIRTEDYWVINSGLNARSYYVWYRVDGVGTDPTVSGKIGVQVNISSYFTAAQVATATASALNLFYIDFTAVAVSGTITITNTIDGACTDASNVSVTIGSIGAGTYQYIALWKWIDNKGRIHRSTPSIAQSIILGSGSRTVAISTPILSLTRKSNVTLEVYRTENLGTLFYKVTSITEPTFNIVNNDARYVFVNFVDSISDADLISNELLYTTGDVLENSSPPPCSIITNYKTRLFIAGLDNKNLIQYSKIIQPEDKDFAVGFNDALYIELSPEGGDIIALSQLDDKLIVFKEKQIYYINGDGPNNTGAGSTFIEPQLVTTDVGCNNANSVVTVPSGLMFKSDKGIYLLTRGLQVQYIGAPVEQFNNLTIASSVLLNSVNQVRFVTENGAALVYNYFFDQWATFTNYEAVDCVLFNDTFTLLRSNGFTQMENTSSFRDEVDGGTQLIPLVLETGNISMAGINGFQRIYRTHILGEYKGTHSSVVSFAYDYSPVYTDNATFDGYTVIGQYTYGSIGPYGESNEDVYGGVYIPYQFRVHMARQKCTAIRIKIEDNQSSNFNEGFNISGITLQVGIKPTPYKLPANKSLGSE